MEQFIKKAGDAARGVIENGGDWEQAILAALRAMREPAQEMAAAGYENSRNSIERISYVPPPEEQSRLIWIAMIDEALGAEPDQSAWEKDYE